MMMLIPVVGSPTGFFFDIKNGSTANGAIEIRFNIGDSSLEIGDLEKHMLT